MKIIFNSLKAILLITLFLGVLSCDSSSEEPSIEFNCNPGDLNFIDVQAEQNIEGIDQTVGSPFENQSITVLTLEQERFETCPEGILTFEGYFETIIKFKNITDKTISFKYVILQTVNETTKQNQGTIFSLSPGEESMENAGEGTFFDLRDAAAILFLENIQYN